MHFSTRPRRGLLYPLLLLAALAVIVLSGVGIAAILGILPTAYSGAATTPASPELAPPTRSEQPAAAGETRAARSSCSDCGTVQSVVPYRTEGTSTGLGAVAGGVVGGLLGNQIGGGSGRKLATIAGAGGGAYVGNRIEKDRNSRTRYKVTVRMDGGNTRSFHLADGGWMPGDRVVVSDGRLLPAGQNRG